MLDILKEFAAFFKILSTVTVPLTVLLSGLFGLYCKTLLQPESKDFRQLKHRLGDDSSSFEQLYQSFLGQALVGTDRFFENSYLKENNPSDPHPWSWRTYRRCMALAIAYPLVFAVLTWGVAGDAGPMGVQLGLTEGIVGWKRGSVCGGLIAMISGFVMFVFTARREKKRTAFISLVFAYAGVFALVGAVAVAGAALGAALRVSLGVGAVAVAFVGLYMTEQILSRKRYSGDRRPSLFWYGLTVIGFCAAWLMVLLTAGPETDANAYIFLVGLVLLPFINAPFDWFSVGLTRKLLQKSLKASAWGRAGWGGLDLIFALLATALLAMVLVSVLEFINATAASRGFPEPVADVKGTLASLSTAPLAMSHMWIYLTLFSTLLPTAIHTCIALGSLLYAYPAGLNRWAYKRVDTAKTDGPFSLFWVACVLTLRWALAVALTFAVSGTVLFIVMSASPLGRWFLKGLQALQATSSELFGQFFGVF